MFLKNLCTFFQSVEKGAEGNRLKCQKANHLCSKEVVYTIEGSRASKLFEQFSSERKRATIK